VGGWFIWDLGDTTKFLWAGIIISIIAMLIIEKTFNLIRKISLYIINDVQLVLTHGKDSKIEKLLNFLNINHKDSLNIITYKSKIEKDHGLIIKNNLTHKGDGMKWLLNFLNLKLENAMAIGDWFNDLSMLQHAGIGVAMKNGEEKVKEIADVITEFDNEQFGAMKHIEKHLL
jgi:hydroxymethylpyrimidine pyrophosphatase-like HAD family hydrolase